MLSLLWRALLFLSAIWLVQRFLGALFGSPGGRTGKKPPEAPRKPANAMVKDPVCGMYLDPRLAIPVENRNGKFYFCSRECMSKYLAQSP